MFLLLKPLITFSQSSTNTRFEAPPFELQLPTHSIRANQNGSEINCRAGISYTIHKGNIESNPEYPVVVSDENTEPYPDGNNHPFEKSYHFVKSGRYFMKLTNTTVNNSQSVCLLSYDYTKYPGSEYHLANEEFARMIDYKLVKKGETQSVFLDVGNFNQDKRNLSSNNKEIKFRVEGGSGHYEIVQDFNQQNPSEQQYWFDTQTNTDMAVKVYSLPINQTFNLKIRDRTNTYKQIELQIETGPNGGIGYFTILSKNQLNIDDDGVLVSLYSGLSQIFKFNCNTGIIDPASPTKFTYSINNSINYCTNTPTDTPTPTPPTSLNISNVVIGNCNSSNQKPVSWDVTGGTGSIQIGWGSSPTTWYPWTGSTSVPQSETWTMVIKDGTGATKAISITTNGCGANPSYSIGTGTVTTTTPPVVVVPPVSGLSISNVVIGNCNSSNQKPVSWTVNGGTGSIQIGWGSAPTTWYPWNGSTSVPQNVTWTMVLKDGAGATQSISVTTNSCGATPSYSIGSGTVTTTTPPVVVNPPVTGLSISNVVIGNCNSSNQKPVSWTVTGGTGSIQIGWGSSPTTWYPWNGTTSVPQNSTWTMVIKDGTGAKKGISITTNACGQAPSYLITNAARIGISEIEIDEIELDKSINIFPNPVSSEVNIEVNNDIIKSIAIINFQGSKIKHVENKGELKNIMKLDVSKIPSGIYIVEINLLKQKIFKKVLIK